MKDVSASVSSYFNIKNIIGNTKILLATKGVEVSFLLDFIKQTNHKFFGENYTSELKKWAEIKQVFPETEVSFIGSFQSGNIRNIVKICDVVETVSSLKQLEKLTKEAEKQSKKIKFYAQINIGKEAQKNGFLESEIKPEFGKLFAGIMCIPPANHNPEFYFKKMKNIAQDLGIKNLSMGMSSDFKDALKHGSTEVRLGSIIFGERKFFK